VNTSECENILWANWLISMDKELSYVAQNWKVQSNHAFFEILSSLREWSLIGKLRFSGLAVFGRNRLDPHIRTRYIATFTRWQKCINGVNFPRWLKSIHFTISSSRLCSHPFKES
jgi:hypothetical protein